MTKSTIALLASLSLAASGCGRSPAYDPPARTPASAAACDCECDDDEDEGIARAGHVEYVRIEEWQPPPSARAVESRIVPRGDAPPSYLALPPLKLHKPIPSTHMYARRYW